MKLQTKQFGEIEFDEDIIISFKEGMIGFENLNRFILIHKEEDIFYWLMSVDEPEITFPLFSTRLLEYDIPEKGEFEAFGIVRLNKEPSEITVNLKAPIYINQQERRGEQVILDSDKFPIDYQLFEKREADEEKSK